MNYEEEFNRFLRLRQLSKHTIENYNSDIRHFLAHYPDPRKISNDELEEYSGP